MIDKDLKLQLIKRTLSNGGEYSDVFVEYRNHTSLVIEDNRLERIITGKEAGAGMRLIYNGKTAYAFSNDLSDESLMKLSSETSKASKGDPVESIIDLSIKKPTVDFDIKLFPEDIALDKKISIVRKADSAARSLDSRIKQVTAIYRDSVQKVSVATSDGFVSEDERIYTTAIIQVVAMQDNIIQTGYESIGGFIGYDLFEINNIEELSLKAAKRAIMMLTARRAPAGRMPVVIASSAGGTMIHEAIGSVFQ
jgi:TldD protein